MVLWLLVTLAAFGVGLAALRVLDEIYHPAVHQPRIEIQAQAQRMVPMPSPEDKPSELKVGSLPT